MAGRRRRKERRRKKVNVMKRAGEGRGGMDCPRNDAITVMDRKGRVTGGGRGRGRSPAGDKGGGRKNN